MCSELLRRVNYFSWAVDSVLCGWFVKVGLGESEILGFGSFLYNIN